MDKLCASCGKSVYPMELLKCIDQTWHRACFKCQTCGMTLNVKNYKAHDKKPFCNAHYPQSKGYTFVMDNQEIQRVKQNTAVISTASYSGRKGSAIPSDKSVIVNRRYSETPSALQSEAQLRRQSSYQRGSINDFDPEEHNTAVRGLDPNAGRRGSTIFVSTALSRSDSRPESVAPQEMPQTDGERTGDAVLDSIAEKKPETQPEAASPPEPVAPEAKPEVVASPEPVAPEAKPEAASSPEPVAPEAKPEVVASPEPVAPEAKPEAASPPEPVAPEAKPEVVASPEPVAPEAKPEVVASPEPVAPEAKPEVVASPEPVAPEAKPEVVASPEPVAPEAKPPPKSVANEFKTKDNPTASEEKVLEQQSSPDDKPEPEADLSPLSMAPEAEPEELNVPVPVAPATPPVVVRPSTAIKRNRGRCYKAKFDYTAQQSDEVSFKAGDLITNGDLVDSGWMYGVVERTKQYGLLPTSYVFEEAAEAF